MFKSIDPEKKSVENTTIPIFLRHFISRLYCVSPYRNENAYDTDTIQHTIINIYTYVIVYEKHERNKSRGQHPNYELYTKFKPIT